MATSPFLPLSKETLETIDYYSQELRVEVDRLLNLTYYPISLASTFFFLFIYKVVSPKISHSLFPRYRSFTPMQRIDWNSRVMSNIHVLIVLTICCHQLRYDIGLRKNPIWCESCLVRPNCAIVIGYLVADLLIMFVNWSVVGEFFFVTHHCVTIYAYFYVMSYGVLPWFANFRLLAEFSTPFVNQRWFFDALGLRKSKGYAINGAFLFISFFLARIVTMPVYYLMLFSVYDYPAFQDLGVLRHIGLIVCLILDSINLYWFSKIFIGAKKLFFGSPAPAKAALNGAGDKTEAKRNESARSKAFTTTNHAQLRKRVEECG